MNQSPRTVSALANLVEANKVVMDSSGRCRCPGYEEQVVNPKKGAAVY
jgi:hypothetical protein